MAKKGAARVAERDTTTLTFECPIQIKGRFQACSPRVTDRLAMTAAMLWWVNSSPQDRLWWESFARYVEEGLVGMMLDGGVTGADADRTLDRRRAKFTSNAD